MGRDDMQRAPPEGGFSTELFSIASTRQLMSRELTGR